MNSMRGWAGMALLAMGVATTSLAGEPATRPAATRPATAEVAPALAGDAAASAEMQKWMEAGEVGPQHKHFERMVGKWTAVSKMWMAPGAPAMESAGSSEFSLALGGRYLMHRYKSTFMDQPYEGMGIDGYDNVRKQHYSMWMDSMSTATMTMTGTCDEKAESCIYFGTMDDVMTGEMGKMYKSALHWTGPDSVVFEMFQMNPGKDWVRMMEITYNRVK